MNSRALRTAAASAALALVVVGWVGPAPAGNRILERADILAWKNIRGAVLSPNGKWFACIVSPTAGDSRTVFRRLSDGHEYSFDSGANPPASITFSADARFAVFALAEPGSVVLVNLANGESNSFQRVSRYSFNGRRSDWLALQLAPTAGSPSAELLLVQTATAQQRITPNVSGFVFDSLGGRLFVSITAADGSGNAIRMRDLGTATAPDVTLDESRGQYNNLKWWDNDAGLLAATRSTASADGRDSSTTLLWFTGFGGRAPPRKQSLDPASDPAFQRGWRLDTRVLPTFSGDRQNIVMSVVPSGGGEGFLVLHRLRERRTIRLEDDVFRVVSIDPDHRWGVVRSIADSAAGETRDVTTYDVYSVDLRSGERKAALLGTDGSVNVAPDGERFQFFSDGHHYVYEIASGHSRNITQTLATSFAEDDVERPGRRISRPLLGWSSDSRSLLLTDGWDVWSVAALGTRAVNLTVNGRRDSIRYGALLFDQDPEAGVELRRPIYLKAVGEWTKKEGVARVENARPGVTLWLWDDARINVWKAADADVWLYTRETATDFPDYYAANAAMARGARITRANPQQEEFAWTAGARLIEYKAGDAARLQAALHLPAGYEEGRVYPTVVVLGDSLSRELHRYSAPTYAGEFSASVYTNRGFAVLLPDIHNRANEPALSALESVSAAVEAAVAAGIVDANRVGLYGRGWGGYQVAATLTQSGKFAAAVAVAPVTNLVNMFGTIYWREKSGDAALRRAVRSRFAAAFWDSSAAYVRNSPVFHAAGATTPLLILHNPADSVVDFNQSADFHGTLKRLGRPAVLLQYPGEGHTLQSLENQVEAATRVLEFLEHFLVDGVEPGWWRGG